jgi:hypothetical protein
VFWNTLSLCSSHNIRDQVSHLYRTTGKIIVLYTNIREKISVLTYVETLIFSLMLEATHILLWECLQICLLVLNWSSFSPITWLGGWVCRFIQKIHNLDSYCLKQQYGPPKNTLFIVIKPGTEGLFKKSKNEWQEPVLKDDDNCVCIQGPKNLIHSFLTVYCTQFHMPVIGHQHIFFPEGVGQLENMHTDCHESCSMVFNKPGPSRMWV